MDNLLEEARGKPSCISIIICNEVIEDKRTNNKTLVSLFNNISVNELPCTHPRLFLMASFANGEGQWPFSVSLRAPGGKVLLANSGMLMLSDPHTVLDVVMEVRNLEIEEEGTYFVDVAVEESVVAYRRFVVRIPEAPA